MPSPLPAPATVLFDLDKTLTDRAASRAAYVERFVADYRGRLGEVESIDLHAFFVRVDRDGYNPDRSADIARELPWRRAPTVAELDRHWQEVMPQVTVADPGLLPLLAALEARSIPVGVVTNGGVRGQRGKLAHLGLTDRLAAIAVSEDLGWAKPDPRIFEWALAQVGARAADALFVGDHPENDILGARAVGMRTAWIHGGAAWPGGSDPSDLSIANLTELRARLFGRGE